MALNKSTVAAALDNGDRVPAESDYARRRTSWVAFTVPAGGLPVSDTIELLEIPRGVRLLGGKIVFEAMSSAAGTANIQLGDGTDADKYLGTTSVDAAGEAEFGHTAALNYGEKVADTFRLTATVLGEAWAAGQRLLVEVNMLND